MQELEDANKLTPVIYDDGVSYLYVQARLCLLFVWLTLLKAPRGSLAVIDAVVNGAASRFRALHP